MSPFIKNGRISATKKPFVVNGLFPARMKSDIVLTCYLNRMFPFPMFHINSPRMDKGQQHPSEFLALYSLYTQKWIDEWDRPTLTDTPSFLLQMATIFEYWVSKNPIHCPCSV